MIRISVVQLTTIGKQLSGRRDDSDSSPLFAVLTATVRRPVEQSNDQNTPSTVYMVSPSGHCADRRREYMRGLRIADGVDTAAAWQTSANSAQSTSYVDGEDHGGLCY